MRAPRPESGPTKLAGFTLTDAFARGSAGDSSRHAGERGSPIRAASPGMPRRVRLRTRGFTLVELLLVCLLVGTLAAVVAPQLSGSAQRSHLDGTARALVALARGARARASAEGRAYFLVVDGERRELRVARARDPLAAAEVEGDSEVEGDNWVEGAPWARAVAFEEGVTLVWARVANQSFAGTGGSAPVAVFSGGVNTTTSSLYGTVADPTPTVGTTTNAVNLPAPVLTVPRVAFDPEGSADDAFFDLELGGDRVRIVVEAASGRTRILTSAEYDASLAGNALPLGTDEPR